MANTESRIPEKREYEGQEHAQSLVNWLNFAPDREDRVRIAEIVRTFTQLSIQRAKMQNATYEKDGKYHERETEDTRKRDELREQLDTALGYYQMRPAISIIGSDGKPDTWKILTFWTPVPGSLLQKNSAKASAHLMKEMKKHPERFWIDEETAIEGTQMGETGAIKIALSLIESGWIWKVGPCRCGKIFFRRFMHQRFCSEKCRIAEFRNSDDARAKRNEYARKLYHLHKSGKVR